MRTKTMHPFSVAVAFSDCILSTANTQSPPRPEYTPPGPLPIRMADEGFLEAEWLEAIVMTDYEVWIAEDTFDSNAEAREFLEGLLDLIGDRYVGDIRKLTVLPRSLR